MGRTLSIVLVMMAGCGSGGSDNTSPASTADGGAAPGTGDFSNGCSTLISLSDSVVTVPATVNALAQVNMPGAFKFSWSVTRAGDHSPIAFSTGNADTSIHFTVDAPGIYRVQVSSTVAAGNSLGAECGGATTLRASPAGARKSVVRIRVTPPVNSKLPRQELLETVYGGTPVDWQALLLESGVLVDAVLRGPGGTGVSGTLHFAGESGIDVLASADDQGAFATTLLGKERYLPLLIPFDGTLAPHRFPSSEQGQLLSADSFSVGAGVVLAGIVRDDQGGPIAGARVTLHDAQGLASGVGVSDMTGAYALHVEPGVYTLTATADGWSDVRSHAMLDVSARATADLRYLAARVPVAAKVLASDGVTPLASAILMLRSHAALAGVAAIVDGNGLKIAGDGDVRVEAMTAQDGSLPSLLLPPGDYDGFVQPPAGVEEGVTAVHVTASITSAAPWRILTQKRVTVGGTVRDASGLVLAGAHVTAVESEGLGSAFVVTTDAQGHWSLVVDPGAPLEVFVDPPAANSTALRAHKSFPTGAPQSGRLDVALEAGILFAGTVLPGSGQPLGGTLVEVYCAGCADSTPIAVGATSSDGRFSVTLPDPGVM